MTVPFFTRPATVADIPALVSLINQAYRGTEAGWTSEGHLLDGPRTDAASLTELLRTGTILTLLHADELVGCVYVQPQGTRLYVGMLAVSPARQAQGLGRQLLGAANDFARQHACQFLTMTVLEARPDLLAWYERHGFQRTGQPEPFPTDHNAGVPRQPLVLLRLEKPVTGAVEA
ncbi:GNAT family N-acetyltransferase [Hymenobacter sp. BT491]|uniref:GNAT family N-acetyltransferase n=1 Tax=Hymenobacter sp. BT491 TaxID=2766779 RepID=UPI0016535D47|nr:GNAT family N-acetyltransferase [Hymenobacter sp. BT491]MBC6991589.1 GNAT family N-acetyltransferase [Hymenobacter sp. BT491]